MEQGGYTNIERTLLILGAGSLGQVVAEMAQMSGQYTKIAFLDDAPTPEKERQYTIVGKTSEAQRFAESFECAIPAVGSNAARLRMLRQLRAFGFKIPRIIHPTAYISPMAEIGDGTIVRAKAAVSRYTWIGEACLINMGALIDHGCQIGDGTHIPMGCVVRNEVKLPPMSVFMPNQVVE